MAKSLIISFQYNIESVYFFYSNPVRQLVTAELVLITSYRLPLNQKYFIFRQHKCITKQYLLLYNITVMLRVFVKLQTKDRLLIKLCGRNKKYFWFSVGSTNGCHIQWLDFAYAYVTKLTKCLLFSASLPHWSIYYFFALCFKLPINNLLKFAKIHEFLLVITNILENNHWICSTDQAVTATTRTNLFGRRVFQIVAAYSRWVLKGFLNFHGKLTGYAEMLTLTMLLNHHSQSSSHI